MVVGPATGAPRSVKTVGQGEVPLPLRLLWFTTLHEKDQTDSRWSTERAIRATYDKRSVRHRSKLARGP